MSKNSSWFMKLCKECDFPVVVTQPDSENFQYADYWWYCSNPKCEYGLKKSDGENLGDMEWPEWVVDRYEK